MPGTLPDSDIQSRVEQKWASPSRIYGPMGEANQSSNPQKYLGLLTPPPLFAYIISPLWLLSATHPPWLG